MTLYEFGNHVELPNNENCALSALFYLESVIGEIVAMTKRFDGNLSSVDIDALSPFVPHSLYKAALILTRDLKNTTKLDRGQALSSLRDMLCRIGVRWLAASMMHEQIQKFGMGNADKCQSGILYSSMKPLTHRPTMYTVFFEVASSPLLKKGGRIIFLKNWQSVKSSLIEGVAQGAKQRR
jgi:hypothetical protein